MRKNILFQDIFEVSDIDPHGKKFDKVSRVLGNSENMAMELTLDLNTEIFPMSVTEKFTLVLASSLSTEASVSESLINEPWRDMSGIKSLADDYDYVMFGKVYKYDDSKGSLV